MREWRAREVFGCLFGPNQSRKLRLRWLARGKNARQVSSGGGSCTVAKGSRLDRQWHRRCSNSLPPPPPAAPPLLISSRWSSYHARSCGSERHSYAAWTRANRFVAPSTSCGFLSGCSLSATLRNLSPLSSQLANRQQARTRVRSESESDAKERVECGGCYSRLFDLFLRGGDLDLKDCRAQVSLDLMELCSGGRTRDSLW